MLLSTYPPTLTLYFDWIPQFKLFTLLYKYCDFSDVNLTIFWFQNEIQKKHILRRLKKLFPCMYHDAWAAQQHSILLHICQAFFPATHEQQGIINIKYILKHLFSQPSTNRC